jgi:hypothetical protein
MKKYIEIREGWARWATTFDCHWKCMASWLGNPSSIMFAEMFLILDHLIQYDNTVKIKIFPKFQCFSNLLYD